jgi:hypothetical protein
MNTNDIDMTGTVWLYKRIKTKQNLLHSVII